MDYDVMSLRSAWKNDKGVHDTEWSLADVGIPRETAIAHMVMRAMRLNEWAGVDFLEAILKGADPEKPYLIRDDRDEIYLWFCIVPDCKQPPTVTDRS